MKKHLIDLVLQTIKKNYKSETEIAEKYFGVLSVLNDLSFSKLEIKLLSYISINGPIKGTKTKEDFASFVGGTTIPTINNTISKVKATGFILKTNSGYDLQESLKHDFKKIINVLILSLDVSR